MRRGFALMAVLWVLVGVAVLGALLQTAARDAEAVAINRRSLVRARWMAEGCLARVSAAAADAAIGGTIPDSVWARLDEVVAATLSAAAPCTITLEPAGMRVDVNAAGAIELRRLAAAMQMAAPAGDSLADGILDWRDADDEPRTAGAEQAWYAIAGRVAPRNGDIASNAEFATVRGVEALRGADSVLGVEPGRLLLSRAPLPVLATLPGFGAEALAHVESLRAAHATLTLGAVEARLGEDARRDLMTAQPLLATRLAEIPDAWIVMGTASDGPGHASARVEWRVVRSGRRLAVLRRRSW